MAEVCATHPARAANGRCARCGKATCTLCALDIDGVLYCSLLCFTKTTLEAKDKRMTPAPDPLSQIDLNGPAEPDLSAEAALKEAKADASVILSAADGID